MSVLIKGLSRSDLKSGDVFIIKMFGSPCLCRLCRVKGGFVSPLLDERGIFWTEEVPTPHGRLIDADDAIIDADERGCDFWDADRDIDNAQEFLRQQPTVIDAEADNGKE